jgi:ParB/RepB/Spo0J family partition protein
MRYNNNQPLGEPLQGEPLLGEPLQGEPLLGTDDPKETPGTLADVLSVHDRLLARSKQIIAKRRADWQHQKMLEKHGPQPEYATKEIYSNQQLIPLDKILDDPTFINFRQSTNLVSLESLQTSIGIDGLRTPITVIEATAPGYYHVRAGFRRTAAIRNLHWKEIPAIVLPSDLPAKDEYWTNIIENTNRDQLSSYETAYAAKWMRDEFNVTAKEFSQKTGVDVGKVYQLLGCIDRLPPEVLQSWKNNDRIPFVKYVALSCMSHLEAIKNLRLFLGQRKFSPPETMHPVLLDRLKSKQKRTGKLWTVEGIERTQRLIMALKICKLPEVEKRRCIDIVEYCQGCRQSIPGIVNDRRRLPSCEFEIPGQDHLDMGLEPPPMRPESGVTEKLKELTMELEEEGLR